MKILDINVEELIEYENNPRFNDGAVDVVEKSIKDFGFKVPIIIDKNNVIVTGHTRLKAAKRLGMKTVPCLVADDLTEEQIKAFRLVDNKTGEFAKWDFERLEEELRDLANTDIFEFGFDDHSEIDWATIDDLNEDTYEEPKGTYLKCPMCDHVDLQERFTKVKEEDINEDIS